MSNIRSSVLVTATLLTFATAACSGATSTAAETPSAAAQQVAVAVSPSNTTLAPSGQQAFTATVTGTIDQSVIWAITEGSAGGNVAAGLYTAPAAAGTYHVTVTSNADPTKSATATVTVTAAPLPIAVAVTPSTASVYACKTVALSASVTGSSNTGVTWSVAEGASGGSVTTSGVYTAPSSGGTYHVVATSQADPTKNARATLTVTESILSVGIAPQQTSVTAGGTVQFTATVTTTCGTSTQALTAGGS